VWLSNEDICGRAVFKLPPNVAFSHARVQIKGVVNTRTTDGPDSLSRTSRTERLPFLGAALNTTAQSVLKTSDGTTTIPFRFNLDDLHSQARSSFITDLPSSLNSRDDKVKWAEFRRGESEADYDVTYSITATAFSKKGSEASTAKTIQVLSVSQAEGPRSPADCPGEYYFAPSNPRPSRASLAKSRSFRIEAAGQNPEAVSLPAHEFFTGASTIPFVLKALPEPSTKFELKSLPTRCRVQARLLSKTLITSDGIEQHWIPIIEQGRHTENTCLRTQRSEEQEFNITLSPWQHVASGSSDQFAISNFSFDFKISTDQARIPTFFTPLLSRRYAIEITISYPDVSGLSSKLTLPLQVAYEESEAFDEKLGSINEKLASIDLVKAEVTVTEVAC